MHTSIYSQPFTPHRNAAGTALCSGPNSPGTPAEHRHVLTQIKNRRRLSGAGVDADEANLQHTVRKRVGAWITAKINRAPTSGPLEPLSEASGSAARRRKHPFPGNNDYDSLDTAAYSTAGNCAMAVGKDQRPGPAFPSAPFLIAAQHPSAPRPHRRTPAGKRHTCACDEPENRLLQTDDLLPRAHHELTSLFECPVCFDYVLPPILQCQAGHLVCNQCRQKLSLCPTCRGSLTPSIRNLAMEKVASAVLFPCKYATTGCSLTLHHTEKPEHEDICEYRPYSCPCPGASCKWQGSLEAVMSHLMHAHKSITTLQGEDIVFLATDINLPGAVDWVMMQSCFGHHFMLVLEKQEKYEGHQQFFAIVLLIGTRKQAENFAYRLELNGNRRRLTWEATPRSIHDGVAAAILNSDCLVFDTAIAHLFADNGNLGINVTISTCCP
nr:PREDICTED: E3 ubiquitin-protein ligase SIAH2 [Apteryx mantelli mantelli]